jgi:hypothetical protein
MQPSRVSPNGSVSDKQPNNPAKARKPYKAARFTVLRPDQAEAELRARAVPADPGAQKLLKAAVEARRKKAAERKQSSQPCES